MKYGIIRYLILVIWKFLVVFFNVLIDRDNHDKVDKKSEKYIFLDYIDDSKGYHLYNLEIKSYWFNVMLYLLNMFVRIGVKI